MLRRLRLWLIKRLGGYTRREVLKEKRRSWSRGNEHSRSIVTYQDSGEFARYMEQYHNAGYKVGFHHGMYAERDAHSCDQAYMDGFEDAVEKFELLRTLWENTDMTPGDFVATFKELRNG